MNHTKLLNAANLEKLSSACRVRLARAEADQMLPVLLRPQSQDQPKARPQGATDLLGALQDAGQTLGSGPRLSHELKFRLKQRTAALRAEIGDYAPLWLADALATHLTPEQVARLSRREDVRQIDLQPTVSPARNLAADDPRTPASPLGLEVPYHPDHAQPRVALIDAVAGSSGGSQLKIHLGFDRHGKLTRGSGHRDLHGDRWLDTLQNLLPDAELMAIDVFEPMGGDSSSPGPLAADYAQVVSGLQLALEQGADVILLDLGEAALDPIWHLPWLNCTLHGATVIVAGCERKNAKAVWPVHLPLAGCYAEGPLRTDILVSGAPIGPWNLSGGLAAATRAAMAVTLIQSAAPKLRRRPDALVGLLFAGPQRGLSPDGDVELDPGEALKAVVSAA